MIDEINMEKENKMQYGYFDNENGEYVVTCPDTPAPWSNYLGSAEFGAVITNNAAGYTFYKSAAQGRLTRYRFNSPAAELCGKFVYLRDNHTNDFWSNSWSPVRKKPDAYECRHGSGYTIIKNCFKGIESEVRYFIPLNKHHEIWQIKISNHSAESKVLSAFPFIEPQCNWNADDDTRNLQYVQYITKAEYRDGIIDIGSNVNMPVDEDNFTNKDQQRHSFFVLHGINADGYDTDLKKFLGNYGTYADPETVIKGQCSSCNCAGDMPCGAYQINMELAPGESRTFFISFGIEIPELDEEVAELAFSEIKTYWRDRLSSLWADTPDSDFNAMVNMWSPYNNLMTFYWSRAASLVYAGERDGLGYRDTVQDIVGAASLITEEARERLELMITGQYSTGGAKDVVKPFDHKPGSEVPSGIYRSDDCLWLFNAVPEYVKETGDFDFYNKTLPYADCGADTVFMHLRRAIEFNLEHSGNHGLPCGLHADWNDCIRLGQDGESVFVAFQLRLALSEFIEIAERLSESGDADWARIQLKELDGSIDKYAWDGEWYLRAYRHDGLKFGSRDNDEGSIFMNPQTWAVISGHAKREKAESCMKALDERLATEYGVMVCTPPYINTDPTICLARLMNPGMKENGAVFNHTQGWGVMAQAALGNNKKAWQYMKAVLPCSYNEMAEIRQVEPYAVCQSTHSKFSPRYGAGRLSWLSGAAVWNYYAMTHAILGIKPHYDGLEVAPCIPEEWTGFTVRRKFRNSIFNITVKHGSVNEITVNGKPIQGTVIPAVIFESENHISVIIKRTQN